MSRYEIISHKQEESNLVFHTPWPANSLSWSTQSDHSIRLAISSYIQDYKNYIQIIEKDDTTGGFISKAIWEHCYPPTKVLLPPRKLDVDLVITTADYLRLWRLTDSEQKITETSNNNNNNNNNNTLQLEKNVTANRSLMNSNNLNDKNLMNAEKEEKRVEIANEELVSTHLATRKVANIENNTQKSNKVNEPSLDHIEVNRTLLTSNTTNSANQIHKENDLDNTTNLKSELVRVFDNGKPNDFCSPVTSCDWNSEDVKLVACCSIDTTVTIWDLERGQQRYKLVAHDKDVYDVAFASAQTFASCGADGSVRFFDLRNMDHCTILYETQGLAPLLRVAWNQQDSNYISTFGLESTDAIVIDVRYPSVPASLLAERHRQPINGMAWSPQSAQNICTVGEDGIVCIWAANADVGQSLFQYTCGKPINSVVWRQVQRQDWIAITTSDGAQLLRL